MYSNTLRERTGKGWLAIKKAGMSQRQKKYKKNGTTMLAIPFSIQTCVCFFQDKDIIS